jgi:topoisomerase IA-like protein
MQGPKKIADAGKDAGKKVLATDTAQGVVEAVVDKLEEITVDKADDVAATVKDRAAKAGGRSPKRSTAKKKSGARKTAAKKTTAKSSPAKKSTGRKKATSKKSSAMKR